jgi:hypothetical protein
MGGKGPGRMKRGNVNIEHKGTLLSPKTRTEKNGYKLVE